MASAFLLVFARYLSLPFCPELLVNHLFSEEGHIVKYPFYGLLISKMINHKHTGQTKRLLTFLKKNHMHPLSGRNGFVMDFSLVA